MTKTLTLDQKANDQHCKLSFEIERIARKNTLKMFGDFCFLFFVQLRNARLFIFNSAPTFAVGEVSDNWSEASFRDKLCIA